jgi:uncharacterized protein DUF6496
MTEAIMPDKKTLQRAQQDKREGKSPSTQAGEFVREEMEHIREGKHGARSAKQAIAIGLSKARRAGVALKVPREGTVPEETRRRAQRESAVAAKGAKGAKEAKAPSPRRSRATLTALKREGSSAASTLALSRQTKAAARKRTAADRSAAARKAARTRARSA